MRILSSILATTLSIAAAAKPVEVMYIVDASYAMTKDLGALTRLEAVQDVLRDSIPALPAGMKAGFSAFGHRSNTDCRDVEVLVLPGSDDRAEIVKQVGLLLPIGKTLTTRAIETSCIILHRQDAHTVVVFIGAGGDDCGGFPCAAVKNLMAQGLGFEFHAIGLAPEAAAEQELKCAATAGKGTYARANNVDELRKAVSDLQAKLPAISREQPSAPAGLGWLHLTFDQAALPAVGRIDITDQSTGEIIKSMNNTATATVHPLPPGKYGIDFTYLSLNGLPPFEIAAGEFEVKDTEHLDVRFGMLKIVLANRPALRALKSFRVIPAGEEKPILTLDPTLALVPRPLPIGEYDIWLDYADTRPSVKLASAAPFGKNGGLIIEIDDLLKKEAP
jgi:hypothetical protein